MSSVPPRERGSRVFQLAPALLGLLGVLVGAAVTGGVTYLVSHNTAKAGERGAERLALVEVLNNHVLLRPNQAQPKRLRLREAQLTDAVWNTERERLARSLSNAEWAWVAKYYRDLEEARGRVQGAMSRLQDDEGCTLVALNFSYYYSRPQGFATTLPKSGTCSSSKPPPAP